jgi:HK97 gp10 family phage protein
MAIDVSGLEAGKANVARIPDVFRERMADATEITAKEIARGAQARIAASPSVRTRHLLNAVMAKMNRRTGRAKVGISSDTMTLAGGRVDIPSKRAHFVEFGTVHMPAEPFMIPAADAQKGPYLNRCTHAGALAERDLSISRTL